MVKTIYRTARKFWVKLFNKLKKNNNKKSWQHWNFVSLSLSSSLKCNAMYYRLVRHFTTRYQWGLVTSPGFWPGLVGLGIASIAATCQSQQTWNVSRISHGQNKEKKEVKILVQIDCVWKRKCTMLTLPTSAQRSLLK